MPPRKANATLKDPPKKKGPSKGYKLPDPLPAGTIFSDISKKKWRLGTSIGQGGFGEIYLATCQNDAGCFNDEADYVAKIEPHSNGPLFTEMHCLMRIAKTDNIETWKKGRKLKRLGMPKFIGSGSFEYNLQKYRFVILERFGSDIQKIIEKHNKQFSFKTVCEVGVQIIDVLEYIHHYEYVHADIKASNLLVGREKGLENQVYLVDYGLACRYMVDGKHKEYRYDQRKAHDGTIEFTSRDAHIGAHSRRGDLEILAYNLIQWLCGRLPWEDKLQDCDYVATQKRVYMDDVPKFMKKCFHDGVPPGIEKFTEYIASLTFDEKPNYDKCRSILREGLKQKGYKDDGKLVFLSATPKAISKIPKSKLNKKTARKRKSEEAENIGSPSPPKFMRGNQRFPCKPRNFNSRNSRNIQVNNEVHNKLLCDMDLDVEELLVQKENERMLAKKNEARSTRREGALKSIKKDTSLENPTPQMLEIMAKMREKSISPVFCTKRHKHTSLCQQIARRSPNTDDPPTELTYAMVDVLRKRENKKSSPRRMSSESFTSGLSSPQLFDSDDELQNATIYYSPLECFDESTDDSISFRNDTKHKKASKPKSRQPSRERKTKGRVLRRRSSSRNKSIPCTRITRRMAQNSSP